MSDGPTDSSAGKGGCRAVLMIQGEHFWCDERRGHFPMAHGSVVAQAIWISHDEHEEYDAHMQRVSHE